MQNNIHIQPFLLKTKRKNGENMKKHLFIISALILSSVILITSSTNNRKEKMNIIKTTNISETERNYILKDYNGRIALFFENDEKPLKIYNIFTDSLPEYDAESLKIGIIVNQNELNNVLSDYIS